MPKEKARGLVVTGVLIAAEPKAAAVDAYEGYGSTRTPKPNKLRLVLEVSVPRPQPPVRKSEWKDEDEWHRNGELRDLKLKLAKDLAEAPKAAKPPKGGHWFTLGGTDEGGEACIGHPKCGRSEPDSVKCFPQPDEPSLDDRKAAAQAQFDAASAEAAVATEKAYETYVRKATEQTQKALAASLGSGLFFALINQEVVVTFEPSSRAFQPLLDLAGTLPLQFPALPSGEPDEDD